MTTYPQLRICFRGFAAALLLVASGPGWAEQYRTQVQEVPDSQAKKATPQDLERQLDSLSGNPYGKSLTLQHLAGLAANKGDYDKARKYLQQAVDLNALSGPAMEEIRANLAQLYAAEGDHGQVIATLEPVLKSGAAPEDINPRAWLALGNAYANKGQWDKAVEPLQRASQAGSRDEALYRLQLAVFMEAGRFEAAADALKELVKLAPNKKAYWIQLAAVQTKRGNHRGAVAALEVAQRRGMLETAAERLQLVRAYLESGSPYDAAVQLQSWIESGEIPTNAGNWQLLAAAWSQAEEFAEAVDPMARAAQATGQAELYAQLGQLQMDLGNWSEAASALQQAVSRGGIGRNTGELLMSLGLAQYQLSRTGAAREAFSRARGYSKVARLAGQWLEFLTARPAQLQPLEIKGLAGAGRSQDESELADAAIVTASSGAQSDEAARQATPDYVPDTGDRWTPVGALRAGNGDGTIPAWTGGLTQTQVPGEYKPGKRVANPYSDESPQFVVTHDNYKQYADVLSAGHRALLEKYSDYRMPVYTTHRNAAYPEAIYRATLGNQSRARLEDPDSLSGARLGFPFRRPNSGVEVMWNHRLRYRSNDIWVRSNEAIVQPDGGYSIQKRVEEILFGYGNLSKPAGIGDNIIAYYLGYISNNGRPSGTALVHETMNKRRGERRIWVSVPGTSRLFRLPPVGYDFPRPDTDNLMFVDQIDMYNGAYDHYVWRLVGRQEMLVPYNSYKLLDDGIRYSNLLNGRFPDTSVTRYERHRVWVVEATERAGADHEFGTRRFYLDEDSWSILMVDNYDESGRLWRFQEGHAVQYPDLQLTYTAPVFIFDIKDGRYFATRLTNEGPPVFYNTGRFEPSKFRPGSVRSRLR